MVQPEQSPVVSSPPVERPARRAWVAPALRRLEIAQTAGAENTPLGGPISGS
jgi:hypothetical protein